MPTWPVTLPQRFERSGFTTGFADLALVTQMDAGPPKRRRRFTAGTEPVSGAMVMTAAQVSDLRSFYFGDVAVTEVFAFPDPVNEGESIDVVFAGAPTIAPHPSPGRWRVSLSLEKQP